MTKEEIQDKVDEFKSLMQEAIECAGMGWYDDAQEYFSDACYVLNEIDNEHVRNKLENLFSVNPYDFAQ